MGQREVRYGYDGSGNWVQLSDTDTRVLNEERFEVVEALRRERRRILAHTDDAGVKTRLRTLVSDLIADIDDAGTLAALDAVNWGEQIEDFKEVEGVLRFRLPGQPPRTRKRTRK